MEQRKETERDEEKVEKGGGEVHVEVKGEWVKGRELA